MSSPRYHTGSINVTFEGGGMPTLDFVVIVKRGEEIDFVQTKIVEGAMGFCRSLFGTQDEPDWLVFAGFCPVPVSVVQIEMHLPSVGIAELPNLKVNDDKAA